MIQEVTTYGSLPSNYCWNIAVLYLSFFRTFKHPVLEVQLSVICYSVTVQLSIYSKISFSFILD